VEPFCGIDSLPRSARELESELFGIPQYSVLILSQSCVRVSQLRRLNRVSAIQLGMLKPLALNPRSQIRRLLSWAALSRRRCMETSGRLESYHGAFVHLLPGPRSMGTPSGSNIVISDGPNYGEVFCGLLGKCTHQFSQSRRISCATCRAGRNCLTVVATCIHAKVSRLKT
jgi:hypothetical protein